MRKEIDQLWSKQGSNSAPPPNIRCSFRINIFVILVGAPTKNHHSCDMKMKVAVDIVETRVERVLLSLLIIVCPCQAWRQ